MDDVQWKDRVVKQDMPTEYDRVDTLPGWSTQGVGNTRCTFYLHLRVYRRIPGAIHKFNQSHLLEKKHHMALEKRID